MGFFPFRDALSSTKFHERKDSGRVDAESVGRLFSRDDARRVDTSETVTIVPAYANRHLSTAFKYANEKYAEIVEGEWDWRAHAK